MFHTKVVMQSITHIEFNNLFPENLFVYEMMWNNIAETDRPQIKIWRTRNACRMPKATNTHTEYVTDISFPLQRWFHERA